MNQSKYNPNYDPKNNPNAAKTDAKTPAPVATVEAPKTPDVAPAAAPAANPAPLQAATTPTVKANEAMVNEGGNSVVIDAPHAVREPSALTDEQAPALQAKPSEGATS